MAPDRGIEGEGLLHAEDQVDQQDRRPSYNSCLFTSLLALAAIIVFLSGCGIVIDFTSEDAVFLSPEAGLDHGHDHDMPFSEPPLADDNPGPSHHTTASSSTGQSSPAAKPTTSFSLVEDTGYLLARSWALDAEPQRRDYHWTISEVEHNPDGVYRRMTLINEQFPGPLIEANDGDTIVVHVHNRAGNATSIHWHGLYQNGTNWMDGTVSITQCPIAPGSDFTYEFRIRGQSGTYWYHAHQAMQVADGLYGPLIIHSRDEATIQEIEYASDRIVMLSDHYHDLSASLMMEYLASDRENVEPIPDAALINGHAVRDCTNLPEGRRCDNTTTNVGLPYFRMDVMQRHRLRLVNVASVAEFQVSVDEQRFDVVEVDGTDVHPASYHRLIINPGQRYSIILDPTGTDPDESTLLRAKMVTACFRETNAFLEPEIHAIFHFTSAEGDSTHRPTQSPATTDWDEAIEVICRDMNTSALHPVIHVRAPANADATFYLRSNFEIGDWRLSRGFFNHSSWRATASEPSLHRVIDGLATGNTSFAAPDTSDSTSSPRAFINNVAFDSARELVVQTSGVAVVDILIVNFDDGNHPMHLHGHKFFVLGQGHDHPPGPEDSAGSLDLENPLRRDTATVEGYGWLLIRVVADNPGLWALHCHIGWHTEAGLLMQLLAGADVLGGSSVPAENRLLCDAPVEDLRKGGTPPDEIFFGHVGKT